MTEFLLVTLKALCFMLGLAAGVSIGYALFYYPLARRVQQQSAWWRQHANYPTRAESPQSLTPPVAKPVFFSVRVWAAAMVQVVRLRLLRSEEVIDGR